MKTIEYPTDRIVPTKKIQEIIKEGIDYWNNGGQPLVVDGIEIIEHKIEKYLDTCEIVSPSSSAD